MNPIQGSMRRMCLHNGSLEDHADCNLTSTKVKTTSLNAIKIHFKSMQELYQKVKSIAC